MTTTDYGACLDCEKTLPTQADAHEHMSATISERPDGQRRGHSVRTLHPTPEQKADRRVSWAIERAIEDFCEDIARVVDRGDITAQQVASALSGYPDFADAWAEYYMEDYA